MKRFRNIKKQLYQNLIIKLSLTHKFDSFHIFILPQDSLCLSIGTICNIAWIENIIPNPDQLDLILTNKT